MSENRNQHKELKTSEHSAAVNNECTNAKCTFIHRGVATDSMTSTHVFQSLAASGSVIWSRHSVMRLPIFMRQRRVCASWSFSDRPGSGLSSSFSAFFTGRIFSLHCNTSDVTSGVIHHQHDASSHVDQLQELPEHTPVQRWFWVDHCRWTLVISTRCRQ